MGALYGLCGLPLSLTEGGRCGAKRYCGGKARKRLRSPTDGRTHPTPCAREKLTTPALTISTGGPQSNRPRTNWVEEHVRVEARHMLDAYAAQPKLVREHVGIE